MQVIDIASADCQMMGFPQGALSSLISHKTDMQLHNSSWFNSAENYQQATQQALEAKSADIDALISNSRGDVRAGDAPAVASVCLAVLDGSATGTKKQLITDQTVLLIAKHAITINKKLDFTGTAVTAPGLVEMLVNISIGKLAACITFDSLVLDPSVHELDCSHMLQNMEQASIVSAFMPHAK